jgi:hypothetical protein
MRDQLEMLAKISGGSAVGTIHIPPFTQGAHPAADIGSLAILQFSAPAPGADGPVGPHAHGL